MRRRACRCGADARRAVEGRGSKSFTAASSIVCIFRSGISNRRNKSIPVAGRALRTFAGSDALRRMYQYNDFDRDFVHQPRRASSATSSSATSPARSAPTTSATAPAERLVRAAPRADGADRDSLRQLASTQLRTLARIAREYDRGFGHFTTRTNIQFNWIPLERAADVMDELAEVGMHGIQTVRQLHPQHHRRRLRRRRRRRDRSTRARSAKSCASGRACIRSSPPCRASSRSPSTAALEDRAATAWYDVGLQLVRNDAGELGFQVRVGGGMGRTPIIGTVMREFLPWPQLLAYLEAVAARLQRLRPARQHLEGAHQGARQGARARSSPTTSRPSSRRSSSTTATASRRIITAGRARPRVGALRHAGRRARPSSRTRPHRRRCSTASPAFARWLERNVHAHRLPGYRAVTLSLKRAGPAAGRRHRPADGARRRPRRPLQRRRAARHARAEPGAAVGARGRPARALARRPARRLRDAEHRPPHRHDLLPRRRRLLARQRALDPGRRRTSPSASTTSTSCTTSATSPSTSAAASTRAATITAATSASSASTRTARSGTRSPRRLRRRDRQRPGRARQVIGPSFRDNEVPDVIEALIDDLPRGSGASGAERFIDTFKRVGVEPFKEAANAARASGRAGVAA